MDMNNRSFTIVEIMVVMAVIGIIMTLSIVGIQAAQKQQRVTTISNDMNQLKLSLASYYSEYRRYPKTSEQIVFDSTNNMICLFDPTVTSPISHASCNDETDRVFNLKLGQPGITWSSSNYEMHYTPCSSEEAANSNPPLSDQDIVIPTPDQWVLDYRYQDTTRPQVYKIRFCTENGGTEFLSQ